jgi:hypothetical protein
MEQPNPDDPLMTDIAEIYSTDQAKFQKNAKEHTKKVRFGGILDIYVHVGMYLIGSKSKSIN